MYIAIDQKFKDIEGNYILENEKEVELKTIIINALLGDYSDEKTLLGDDKLKRWDLAIKIKQASDTVELSAEEIVLIKFLVGKPYTTTITGQAYKMLENNKTGGK